MNYNGKLYGMVQNGAGKMYFPLEATTEDFDNLELHTGQLIMMIEDFLEPLHPIRHNSSFLKLKKISEKVQKNT